MLNIARVSAVIEGIKMKKTFANVVTNDVIPKTINFSAYVGAIVGAGVLVYNAADSVDTYNPEGEQRVLEYIDQQADQLAETSSERLRIEEALSGKTGTYAEAEAEPAIDPGKIINDIETTLLLNPDISEEALQETAEQLFGTTGYGAFNQIAEKARYHDECRIDNPPANFNGSRIIAADEIKSCMAEQDPNNILAGLAMWFALGFIPLHRLPGNIYRKTISTNSTLRRWKHTPSKHKLGQN